MSRSAVLLAGLSVLCALALAIAGEQPQPESGSLDSNQSLFAVLAAINAAGYDADLASPANHPLRQAVRRYIESKNPDSLKQLKEFFRAHRKLDWNAELSQYISYAVCLDGPPSFKPRFSANQMPPDAAALEGLGGILSRFWDETDLQAFWKQAQPAHEEVIGRYHPLVTKAVFESNLYLRNPTSGMRGRRFQVIIDLLGAPNQVHTRSFGDDYFVVVTPSAEVRVKDIRRAYLHNLLDPLAIRNAALLEKKKGLGDLAGASPVLDEVYKNDFVLLAGMSLVKAVEARLERQEGPALVDQAMREGFILTACFFESLIAYEKQDRALRLYLPEMIEKIDLAKEDRRIGQVQFASAKLERKVKPAAPAAPILTGAEAELETAEELYRKRDLESAGQAYRKLIQDQAPKAIHAKAWFGLARIAVLEKKPELAQQLFERTLEQDPEPFERAWTCVYLARLARAAQDPDAARKHYQAALAVEGASETARKAAGQELSDISAATTPDLKHKKY